MNFMSQAELMFTILILVKGVMELDCIPVGGACSMIGSGLTALAT